MVCVLFGDVCTWSCATGCSPLSSRSGIQVLTTPIALFGCTSSWSKWSSKNARPNEFLLFPCIFSLVGFRCSARWCFVGVGVGVGVVSAIVVGK